MTRSCRRGLIVDRTVAAKRRRINREHRGVEAAYIAWRRRMAEHSSQVFGGFSNGVTGLQTLVRIGILCLCSSLFGFRDFDDKEKANPEAGPLLHRREGSVRTARRNREGQGVPRPGPLGMRRPGPNVQHGPRVLRAGARGLRELAGEGAGG